MKRLPGRREHLETFLDGHAPSEDGHHFPQRPSGEANSDISTPGLRSAHGQANNLAPLEAEIRTTDRTRYKAHQDALNALSEMTKKRRQGGI